MRNYAAVIFSLLITIICIEPTSADSSAVLLFPGASTAMMPTVFDMAPELVSDETDQKGYCLTVRNGDIECYTFRGRFLGVGTVSQYYNGNLQHVYAFDKAPLVDRRIIQNAFLRVWAIDPSKAWYSDNTANN